MSDRIYIFLDLDRLCKEKIKNKFTSPTLGLVFACLEVSAWVAEDRELFDRSLLTKKEG
jgi:hypothetical protein